MEVCVFWNYYSHESVYLSVHTDCMVFKKNVPVMKVAHFYILPALLLIALMFSCSKEEEKAVVINELMPRNSTTVSDENDEFDDWIEFYNNSMNEIDLSGYYLSDNLRVPYRWQFPEGTKIGAQEFLIVWADDDTLQVGLHANFRLSADGEELVLLNPKREVIDYVKFGAQSLELSYSRIPNGTGEFSWQHPTFYSVNVQTIN